MGGIIDNGVCLRTWDWSETSQTALIFFRGLGLLRVLAKGSRRAGSPYSGGLEAVTRAEARVFTKRAGGLSTLASWDLDERFDAPRRTLSGFSDASYMTEVVSRVVTELDPHPGLYDALVDGLRAAGSGDHAVVSVQWAALVECGHQPDLGGRPTQKHPMGEGVFDFSPLYGRMISPGEPVAGEIWRVRESTVNQLRALDGIGTGTIDDPIITSRARRFLGACLIYTLGIELRSANPVTGSPETGDASPDR